jgi:hypothetical protein
MSWCAFTRGRSHLVQTSNQTQRSSVVLFLTLIDWFMLMGIYQSTLASYLLRHHFRYPCHTKMEAIMQFFDSVIEDNSSIFPLGLKYSLPYRRRGRDGRVQAPGRRLHGAEVPGQRQDRRQQGVQQNCKFYHP